MATIKTIKDLKDIIKDLPDNMEIAGYKGGNGDYDDNAGDAHNHENRGNTSKNYTKISETNKAMQNDHMSYVIQGLVVKIDVTEGNKKGNKY